MERAILLRAEGPRGGTKEIVIEASKLYWLASRASYETLPPFGTLGHSLPIQALEKCQAASNLELAKCVPSRGIQETRDTFVFVFAF